MHQKMRWAAVLPEPDDPARQEVACRVLLLGLILIEACSLYGDVRLMTQRYSIRWQQPDGSVISCEEKLKILDENLAEIRQMCQDAFEDALLMGCDELQVRGVFSAVIESLHNPHVRRR